MSHTTIPEEAMNANLPKAQHSLTRLRKDYNPHLRQPKSMSQGHTHPKADFLTLLTEELRNFSNSQTILQVVNISENYATTQTNDFLVVFNEIIRKCYQPLAIAWMEEELCLVTSKPDMRQGMAATA
ncbi:Uncharacterized protein Fot_39211 [Forsythia ovata]|uniref:Uncharacterized protein n=1 Tax=Forsythia ovata TaxID=205694 RepID=A0ABD1S3Y0_9LAMI